AWLRATADSASTMYMRGLTGRIMQHPQRLVTLDEPRGCCFVLRRRSGPPAGRSPQTLRPVGQLQQRLGQLPRLARRDVRVVREMDHGAADVHGGAGLT